MVFREAGPIITYFALAKKFMVHLRENRSGQPSSTPKQWYQCARKERLELSVERDGKQGRGKFKGTLLTCGDKLNKDGQEGIAAAIKWITTTPYQTIEACAEVQRKYCYFPYGCFTEHNGGVYWAYSMQYRLSLLHKPFGQVILEASLAYLPCVFRSSGNSSEGASKCRRQQKRGRHRGVSLRHIFVKRKGAPHSRVRLNLENQQL